MESVKEVSKTKHDKKMKILILRLSRIGTTNDEIFFTLYCIARFHKLICFQLWSRDCDNWNTFSTITSTVFFKRILISDFHECHFSCETRLWERNSTTSTNHESRQTFRHSRRILTWKTLYFKNYRLVLKILQCILDVSCCFFVENLCKIYSNAKIILNTRNSDEWLQSMQNTLFIIFQWRSWQILRYLDLTLTGVWCRHNELIWDYFCDNEYDNNEKCKRRFLKHYEYVRKMMPTERLLKYNIKDEWKSVTNFLKLFEFRENVKRNSVENCLMKHVKLWWTRLKINLLNLIVIVVEFDVILIELTLAQAWSMWFKMIIVEVHRTSCKYSDLEKCESRHD